MNKIKQFFISIGLWFKNAGIAIGKWFKNWFVTVDENPARFVTIGLWFKRVGIAIGRWFASWFVSIDGKRAKFVSIGRWFASWFVSIDGNRPKFVSIGRWFASWFVSIDDKRPKFVSIGLWFKNWAVEVDGKPNHFIKIGRWTKGLFVSVENKEPGFVTLYKKESTKSIISSLLCILCGVVIGVIVLAIVAAAASNIPFSDVWKGFLVIISGAFFTGNSANLAVGFNQEYIGNMLLRATPLLMTGLSIAIAYKTGLFNIGAPGQYLMGTMGSLLVAHGIPNDGNNGTWIWLLALIVGILCGMLWGAIPGIFKALLNINEVIVCIMTNWAAASIVSWVFSTSDFKNVSEGKAGFIMPTNVNGVQNPRWGMDKLFAGSWADSGIIIAIIIAILMFIILNKTTFGYEIKACGFNKNASKYAGMNEKRNIVLSMAIAGGLAACGAALYFLNGRTEFAWETSTSLPAEGFNGIPIALLASNNPIGVIFSALFMAYLDVGGSNMASVTSFNEYIADFIVAVIIYFAGFANLFKMILNRKHKKKTEGDNNTNSAQHETSAQPDATENITITEEAKQ